MNSKKRVRMGREALRTNIPKAAVRAQAAPPPVPAPTKELARRELMRRRLLYFTKETLPGYQAGWVHDDICRRLERFSQQVMERRSPRLMLLMPPRHGKSELASIRFPAWHLGHNPTHEVVNVGYNMDLPMRFSRKVRELIRDPLYTAVFPSTQLDPESQSVEAWMTTMGGGLTAIGVGGGLTGKGAHVLTIDDPIKNIEEADSIIVRDRIEDWYESTAYTRLAPGGGVLIIETWWNDDDLAGRIQQKARLQLLSDKFEVVKYPAISELYEFRHKETLEIVRLPSADISEAALAGYFVSRKLLGDDAPPGTMESDEYELLRTPNEALHSGRYPIEELQKIKANMSRRHWSALYQQNPVPDEGAYFRKDYFRWITTLPLVQDHYVYTAWDFAIGEKQQNDWNVGATISQDTADTLFVQDIERMKGDSFAIVESILNVAERWYGKGKVYMMGFEDGQIWRAIEPLLKKRMQERKLFPAYEVLKPLTDKLARARNLQGRMQNLRVVFPESAPWKDQAEQELLRFPAGVHDDVVDALAWAVNLCIGKDPPPVAPGVKLPSWKDKLFSTEGGSHMAA